MEVPISPVGLRREMTALTYTQQSRSLLSTLRAIQRLRYAVHRRALCVIDGVPIEARGRSTYAVPCLLPLNELEVSGPRTHFPDELDASGRACFFGSDVRKDGSK